MKSDPNKRLKPLTVIPLSGPHCMSMKSVSLFPKLITLSCFHRYTEKEKVISCAMLLVTTKRFIVCKQISFLVAFKINFLSVTLYDVRTIKILIKLECFAE